MMTSYATPPFPPREKRNDQAPRMHRAAIGLLKHHGVHPAAKSADDLLEIIRRRMPVMTIREDGGRMHPMGLQITPERAGRHAYMSAVGRHGRTMTSLVLPVQLPATVRASAAGRALRDILALPGLGRGLLVAWIEEVESVGTIIVLQDDYAALPQ